MQPARVTVNFKLFILFISHAWNDRFNVNHGHLVYSITNNHKHRFFLLTIMCKWYLPMHIYLFSVKSWMCLGIRQGFSDQQKLADPKIRGRLKSTCNLTVSQLEATSCIILGLSYGGDNRLYNWRKSARGDLIANRVIQTTTQKLSWVSTCTSTPKYNHHGIPQPPLPPPCGGIQQP